MRSLLVFAVIIFIYYALKIIFHSALKAYHEDGGPTPLKGEEMVLDPECRTYVIKDRAVKRRIQGAIHSFCSETCAKRYEETHRD
jgi:YHS domain-containing protein